MIALAADSGAFWFSRRVHNDNEKTIGFLVLCALRLAPRTNIRESPIRAEPWYSYSAAKP